jgi:hypothetical protein
MCGFSFGIGDAWLSYLQACSSSFNPEANASLFTNLFELKLTGSNQFELCVSGGWKLPSGQFTKPLIVTF